MINYITEYICFINVLDSSFFLYISCENVDYNTVNSLMAKNFLLDKMRYHYCSSTICYILHCTLKKYFGIKLKMQKHVREKKLLFKYFN